MHRISTLLSVVVVCLVAAFATAQQPAAAADSGNTDIYHVHFNKAVPGKAAELLNMFKEQGQSGPMPGHFIVLRHRQGDDWDYAVISHLGTSTTLDTKPTPAGPTVRGISSWHTDTFVSGPGWKEFAKAMGLDDPAKSAGSVYTVAVWRAVPGHYNQLRDELNAPSPDSKVQVSNVVMQHMEGGPWQFLAIGHYNSWQDFASDSAATASAPGWDSARLHGAWHRDTIADRVAPTSGMKDASK